MSDYFDDTVLPAGLAYATSAASDHRTQIIETGSGFEFRNSVWHAPKRAYRFAGGPQDLDRLLALKQFFDARGGRLRGFLLRDWADDNSASTGQAVSDTDQTLTPLDEAGYRFGLQKSYVQSGRLVSRAIIKPKADTLRLVRNHIALEAGQHFTLDARTGIVTLSEALASGDRLTAGFEFYVPVRFDSDILEITRLSEAVGAVGPLAMVELNLGLDRAQGV